MKSMSRLHLYPHKEPNGRAYIVAEKKALKALAKKIEQAAEGVVGVDTLRLYGSDGHEFELMIVSEVAEEEWQSLPLPYDKKSDPSKLETVKLYDNLKPETK